MESLLSIRKINSIQFKILLQLFTCRMPNLLSAHCTNCFPFAKSHSNFFLVKLAIWEASLHKYVDSIEFVLEVGMKYFNISVTFQYNNIPWVYCFQQPRTFEYLEDSIKYLLIMEPRSD